MKFLFALILVYSSAAFGTDRVFECKGVDRIGRLSDVYVNVDAAEVTVKDSSSEKVILSRSIACGHEVRNLNCSADLKHNLDDANRVKDSAYFRVKCMTDSGRIIQEMNGLLEIHIYDVASDAGMFICGSLPRNDIALHNCRVVTKEEILE